MTDLAQTVWATISRLDLRSLLDISIVAFILYWLLLLLRGTTAMTLLRGMVILILLGFVLGNLLQLTVLSWILRNSFTALLVAIPILFQPELRRALERIGRTGLGLSSSAFGTERMIDTLSRASRRLSEQRYGALIVIERETGLQEYADTGVGIDANVSVELLLSIFYPNSPLHDGAVILREDHILAASCVLPLSENTSSDPHLGTRHRAAMGITERTDALSIVISEETGAISLARHGRLSAQADDARLRRSLIRLYRAMPEEAQDGRRPAYLEDG